jgi:hypothetical protein
MAGATFIAHPVARRGGVLFIAAEGEPEIAIRLQAVLQTKYPAIERAPFAWTDVCVQLVEPESAETLETAASAAAARMRADFDLPLALIVVDTVVASAGYSRSGDENDAAINHAIMSRLAALSRESGALVLGIDHFGKTAETGTRGSSAKEGGADVVLALLGDKEVTGTISDTRLALRKSRVGAGGQEFPFTVRVVNVGDGDVTSLVIDWQDPGAVDATKAKKKKDGWTTTTLQLLRQALTNVLATHARDCWPFADGPKVRAVDAEFVRTEFCKSKVSLFTADKKKQDAAKRQAWGRAITAAQARKLIGVREVEGKTVLWFVTPPTQ